MNEFLDFCESNVKNASCDISPDEAKSEYSGISALPKNPVSAMAYVPFQTDTSIFDADTGYKNGTIFAVLNKPFLGGCCI